jgi:hypothetical protein
MTNRPPSMVQVSPEDQQDLEKVGDMWLARMSMRVRREPDGTFWADPAEYAEWRDQEMPMAKSALSETEKIFVRDAEQGFFDVGFTDEGRPYAIGANLTGNLFSMEVNERPESNSNKCVSLYTLPDDYYEFKFKSDTATGPSCQHDLQKPECTIKVTHKGTRATCSECREVFAVLSLPQSDADAK